MTQLLTYPDIDPQQWNELVQSSPTATWFQTDEAYEFYAANPEEMTPFAYGVVELKVKGERLEAKGTDECKVESVKFKGEEKGKADTPASTPYTLHQRSKA